jgi:hypothetical protein
MKSGNLSCIVLLISIVGGGFSNKPYKSRSINAQLTSLHYRQDLMVESDLLPSKCHEVISVALQ